MLNTSSAFPVPMDIEGMVKSALGAVIREEVKAVHAELLAQVEHQAARISILYAHMETLEKEYLRPMKQTITEVATLVEKFKGTDNMVTRALFGK